MILQGNKYSQKNQQSILRDEAYSSPCPYCGAGPGENCRSGGRTYWGVHRSRRPRQEFKPEPQWVEWWIRMKPYECCRRPAGLRVPSQSEILQGAS